MFLKDYLVVDFFLIFISYVHGQDLSILGYFDCMHPNQIIIIFVLHKYTEKNYFPRMYRLLRSYNVERTWLHIREMLYG